MNWALMGIAGFLWIGIPLINAFLPFLQMPITAQGYFKLFFVGIVLAMLALDMDPMTRAVAVGFSIFIAIGVMGGTRWLKVAIPTGGIGGLVAGLASLFMR